MKRLFFTIFTIALMATSCSKDGYISPEELFKDSSKAAKTTINTKGEKPETAVATFKSPVITKRSDIAGQSHLWASSGGKMVYDFFILSIYFENVDNLKVGDTINPSRFMFSFPASSNSEATTHTYDGNISIADKGDNYVILHFDKVGFSCSIGEYLTDGYLYCNLIDIDPSLTVGN